MNGLTLRRKTLTARGFIEKLEDVDLEMTLIPAGEYWMGTPDDEIERLCKEYESDLFRRESPQHLVQVPKFFLGQYPVTQGQWQIVASWEKEERDLEANPSSFKESYQGQGHIWRPVEKVSWLDAKEFCTRLKKRTGKPYRLPTEAEWEYACRGILPQEKGEKITQAEWNKKYHKPFHFGITISAEYTNYDGTYAYGKGKKGENREQTTPVGYFKVANNFGLYDMHGNVCEWCEDDYHNSYEGAPTDGSAWLEKINNNHTTKTLRGGSWSYLPGYCRSAFRYSDSRIVRDLDVGFRVACSSPNTP